MPRRFGFGLGFNISRLSGLPAPSGFVAKYQAYDVNDFTLVTGSNTSQWDDRTTQTFGSELVTNGGFDVQGDWNSQGSNVILTIANSELTVISATGATGAYQVINTEIGKKYQFIAYSDQTVTNGLIRVSNGSVPDAGYGDSYVSNGVAILDFVALGTSTTIYLRNTNAGTSVWQEVSVKEILTGANHLTQGTSLNQPTLTQNANRFNNTVDFGANDFMTGLPTQSGDFTYVFKGVSLNISGSLNNVLLSNGISNQSLFFVANYTTGNYAIRPNGPNVYEFSVPYSPTDRNIALIRELNTLTLYINGFSVDTLDVTGLTFDFPLLGRSSTSINGSLQELYVYDRALTQDEINWFSYLRDSNNNISPLPPILPS